MLSIPDSKKERLQILLNTSFELFMKQLTSGKININKEASMQLHYSNLIHRLGDIICIEPREVFNIELETAYDKKNIDITCGFDDVRAAIELKCFRKKSNRPLDTDMYDVLKDIERLYSYKGFSISKFICLTDDKRYISTSHTGHAGSVSIGDGVVYRKGTVIEPSWIDMWKDKSRDKSISFPKDVVINWNKFGEWYYLNIDLI
jgi:hypothetical protein